MENKYMKAMTQNVTQGAFLKKILSYPYEHVGNSCVFRITNAIDIEQIYNSRQIVVCGDVDTLKRCLEEEENVNLYVSSNLVNQTLLEKLLAESSQSKNIFLGDD